MASALSSIQDGIGDTLGARNKSKKNINEVENFSSQDSKKSRASEYSKIHDRFIEDEALKVFQKITQGGLGGYVGWKIEEIKERIKAKVAQQVMDSRGITKESLSQMTPNQRAEVEDQIAKEVARLVKDMIEEAIKKDNEAQAERQDQAKIAGDSPNRGLIGRLAPTPPLMAESDGGIRSLEDNIRGSLADLYGDNSFLPRPPISLTVDDRGKIAVSGERDDIADIQAAIDNDLELTRDLQRYGAAVASSAMLAAEANASASALPPTGGGSAAAYQDWIAERTLRQSVLRFDGAQIELVGANKITRNAR